MNQKGNKNLRWENIEHLKKMSINSKCFLNVFIYNTVFCLQQGLKYGTQIRINIPKIAFLIFPLTTTLSKESLNKIYLRGAFNKFPDFLCIGI